MTYLQRGTAKFHRANWALFAGGFVTFAILYSTQPLLPNFVKEFGISPLTASFSLSTTTATLAVFMLVAGSLSEAWGRKTIMGTALLAASVMGLLTAFSANFAALLVWRVLLGVFLAGLPAIAMAYLGEEVSPNSLGLAMGLYISGNSIGGMSGRIITGMLTDAFSWRVALAAIAVVSLLSSILFWVLLPPSRNFHPRKLQLGKLTKSLLHHLTDGVLLRLYGLGFLLMGSFVTLYNYIGFQLLAKPYSLSQTAVGWIFIVYLVGTFSSTWMGRLADSHGQRKVLWIGIAIMLTGVGLTLIPWLWLKLAGIAVFTFGFFGSHSIASSWVGKRAKLDKAQASSLYLFFYYVGSSVGGSAGGALWGSYGWDGVVAMIAAFLLIAIGLSARLSAFA
ncbi:MFS transporter [Alicyclobacillus tolerans]|uniref:MFS transporter n=1 Tax=Alicyclobacillus tolerans TaxID=90970 RepID=UPI001F16125F|nr:MFS transporter [Alicyclobacillus tolerans]MCF8564066.1 MFS transporter [Alicyclobacillus tolerans]